jgi:DegV family protein with EDD domain
MREVTIVTDTTACIPAKQVAKYQIEVVPVSFIFEEKAYRDGIDITPTEFYALLRQSKTIPTTSASSPEPYLEAYRKAGRRTKNILCITESSKFSAMFNSAQIAKKMAKKDIPGVVIELLECTTAAVGQGLVALAAAKAAASGKNLAEVVKIARETMSRVELYASLDTLHYLVKGGRVPQAAALVNSLLKIKPVFTINHGDAHTVALPRTMKSAVNHMLKIMEQKVVRGKPLHVAVMHAAAPNEAISLRNRIASKFDCTELFITEFTPVMGVHTGPGLLGIAFYNDE